MLSASQGDSQADNARAWTGPPPGRDGGSPPAPTSIFIKIYETKAGVTADRCPPRGPRWRRLLSLDLFRSSKKKHIFRNLSTWASPHCWHYCLGSCGKRRNVGEAGPLESSSHLQQQGPSVSLLLHQEGQTDRHWVLFGAAASARSLYRQTKGNGFSVANVCV